MNARNDIDIDPDDRFATRLADDLVSLLYGQGRLATSPPRLQEDMTVITLDEPTHEAPPSWSRWLTLAAAALLAVGAGALILLQRDDGAPADRADVVFEITWPSLSSHLTSRCVDTEAVYESAFAGHCLHGWTGEATLAGDIAGTAIFDMASTLGDEPGPGVRGANLATFNATYLVRGSVAGCGSGEFMIAEQLQYLGWANGSFVGTWQILPGSGRGELANVSGSGATPTGPEGDGGDEAPRTHLGSIDCG